MTEKELAKKLKQLRETKANSEWKMELKNVLWQKVSSESKASSSDTVSSKQKIYAVFAGFFKKLNPAQLKKLPQPALAMVVAVFLVLTGGALTVNASDDAKPGSPLYFARIIKEKAQLVTTLDEEKKTRLSIKFASNHAKDISDVLSSPEFKNADNPEEREKLSRNFEENINSVRMQLQEMRSSEDEQEGGDEDRSPEKDDKGDARPEERPAREPSGDQGDNVSQDPSAEEGQDDGSQEGEEPEEEEKFFSVDSQRDDNGIQLHTPEKEQNDQEEGSEDTQQDGNDGTDTEEEVDASATGTTSTSPEDEEVSQELESAEKMMDSDEYGGDELDQLITRAEDLFEQGKYDQVRETLDEFMNTIASQDTQTEEGDDGQEGEVKGDFEEASSTPESEENASNTPSTTASTTDQNE